MVAAAAAAELESLGGVVFLVQVPEAISVSVPTALAYQYLQLLLRPVLLWLVNLERYT